MAPSSLPKKTYVKAFDGSPLTLADLPSTVDLRWTMRHKANLVLAVRGGLIGADEACSRYKLTPEEFASWFEAVDRFGPLALRSTRLQEYKRKTQERLAAAAAAALRATQKIGGANQSMTSKSG